MDGRHCYFPNYWKTDNFEPSPSHWPLSNGWPLSNVRSSVKSQDDSSDDTFEMDWVGDRGISIPIHERTIKDLTGRPLKESLATLKRRRSPPPSASPSEPGTRKTPDPRYLLRKECPSSGEAQPSAGPSRRGHQEIGLTNADAAKQVKAQEGPHLTPDELCRLGEETVIVDPANGSPSSVEETKQKPAQRNTAFARKSGLHRHNRKHIETEHEASMTSSPRRISARLRKTPQTSQSASSSLQLPIPAHHPEPTVACQPPSQNHIQPQDNASSHQASLSQSAAPPLLSSELSDDDNDAMNSDESFNPNRQMEAKQPKQQSQKGSHICPLCDITFTRHFDLVRHSQKHQVETYEDKAAKTCPNCEEVLSRVDATKRHVDTLPESCNYIRRKKGLKPLPAMSAKHIAERQARYNKLAQKRKKPKGRKKANPVA